MKKGEFLVVYNVSVDVSNQMFNKLGLKAKKFTNKFKGLYEDLSLEEIYIRYDFAIKEGEAFKKDEKGTPIVKAESEKEFLKKLSEWKKEEVEVDLSDFTFVELDEKLIKMLPPSIYDTLNGYLFSVSEDEYLSIITKEESH